MKLVILSQNHTTFPSKEATLKTFIAIANYYQKKVEFFCLWLLLSLKYSPRRNETAGLLDVVSGAKAKITN